jgi:N-acetyl-gamma-glutamyl-phosphate reductase
VGSASFPPQYAARAWRIYIISFVKDFMIDVGIVGGSGYTGGELLRLLANHPKVKVVAVTSRKLAGKSVTTVHPHLKSIYSQSFEALSGEEVAKRCDIVFTAVPHGTAMDWVPELLDGGARCFVA